MLLRTFAAKRRFNTKAARAAKRKLRSLDSNALVKQHREFIDALSDDQLFRLRILFDQYAEDLGFVRAKELRPVCHSTRTQSLAFSLFSTAACPFGGLPEGHRLAANDSDD